MKHANEPGSKNLRRFVSFKLLSEQTEDVGMIMLALQKKKGKADREQGIRLEGIWNLLHIIMDDLEVGQECILESRRKSPRK